MDDEKYIHSLTRLSSSRRQDLLLYYARLPEAIRIEAHKLQMDLVRQNRNLRPEADRMPTFYYAFLLAALSRMKRLEESQNIKSDASIEEAARITEIRMERIKARHRKKNAPVRDLVEVRYFEEIKRFRSKGVSWRDIAAYIAKYHKHRISHVYLKTCFNRIDNQEAKEVKPHD